VSDLEPSNSALNKKNPAHLEILHEQKKPKLKPTKLFGVMYAIGSCMPEKISHKDPKNAVESLAG